MKKHALEHFRRPPQRLNCAQSVLHAYHQATGDTATPITEMKALGGGRAPGGVCGALHVACTLLPDKAEVLKAKFSKKTGSTLCRELREANVHPCEDCVTEAAELLGNELGLHTSKGA